VNGKWFALRTTPTEKRLVGSYMPLLWLSACMDAHTVIEEWEVSPFDGGFERIHELCGRGFSGAVEADNSWLFLRDGESLAVLTDLKEDPQEGSIERFEEATGRTHEAPHPATATLAAMLALDGDVRGQYFSDETPLSTVHETLSEGGFTGYVELSENVLSGDYYVVYEDGTESYLGYLGPSGRLLTDEEARSKAEGEVGIYDVVAVRFPTVALPDPAPESSEEKLSAVTPTDTESGDNESATTAAEERDTADSEEADPEEAEPLVSEGDESDEPEEGAPDDSRSVGDGTPTAGEDGDPERGEAESEPVEEDDTTGSQSVAESTAEQTDDTTADQPEKSSPEEDRTHTIPSIDPENSGEGREDDATRVVITPHGGEMDGDAESDTEDGVESEAEAVPEPEHGEMDADATESEPGDAGGDAEARVEELRSEYEAELSSLRSEIESLRTERNRLRERITDMETSVPDESSATGVELSAAEAFDGTSLFIREDSRAGATLENAHGGDVDPEALAENLRIEYHTRFDDEGATVDEVAFDSFLRSSTPYAFVEWLITKLLFEIQSTGSTGAMRPLYDALPDIDRVSFDDTIPVGDGQEGRELAFDIVARDRMGDPLVVANLDESREPTTSEAMGPLINDASDVCEEHETLVAAFAVTTSFFESDALSTAREATSGSLLSREKYRSYVKLSRKNGFHLCLAEFREETFHLAVPEL
jgi:hypothetical protein